MSTLQPNEPIRSLDAYIATTPDALGGRPRIAGTRISVAQIAIAHLRAEQSVSMLAEDYDLSPAQIHAALAYYFDHKAEIDRALDEDERALRAYEQAHPNTVVRV